MNAAQKYLADPKFRKALYSLATALVPVLVMLGVVTEVDAARWLAAVVAVASASVHLMAAVNTNTSGNYEPEHLRDDSV